MSVDQARDTPGFVVGLGRCIFGEGHEKILTPLSFVVTSCAPHGTSDEQIFQPILVILKPVQIVKR